MQEKRREAKEGAHQRKEKTSGVPSVATSMDRFFFFFGFLQEVAKEKKKSKPRRKWQIGSNYRGRRVFSRLVVVSVRVAWVLSSFGACREKENKKNRCGSGEKIHYSPDLGAARFLASCSTSARDGRFLDGAACAIGGGIVTAGACAASGVFLGGTARRSPA